MLIDTHPFIAQTFAGPDYIAVADGTFVQPVFVDLFGGCYSCHFISPVSTCSGGGMYFSLFNHSAHVRGFGHTANVIGQRKAGSSRMGYPLPHRKAIPVFSGLCKARHLAQVLFIIRSPRLKKRGPIEAPNLPAPLAWGMTSPRLKKRGPIEAI